MEQVTLISKVHPKIRPYKCTLFSMSLMRNLFFDSSSIERNNCWQWIYLLFSLQAIESRGISELLFTSDTHEGLKTGGLSGGTALTSEISSDIPQPIFSTAFELKWRDFAVVSVLRTLNLRKLNYEDVKYLESVQVIRLFNHIVCLIGYWMQIFHCPFVIIYYLFFHRTLIKLFYCLQQKVSMRFCLWNLWTVCLSRCSPPERRARTGLWFASQRCWILHFNWSESVE